MCRACIVQYPSLKSILLPQPLSDSHRTGSTYTPINTVFLDKAAIGWASTNIIIAYKDHSKHRISHLYVYPTFCAIGINPHLVITTRWHSVCSKCCQTWFACCPQSGVYSDCAESGHTWHPGHTYPHYPTNPTLNEATFWMWDGWRHAVGGVSDVFPCCFLGRWNDDSGPGGHLYIDMYLREHLVCGDITCDNSPLPKWVWIFSSCRKADQFGHDMAVYVGLIVVNNLCLVIALFNCLIVTLCSLLSSLYDSDLPVQGNFASTTCGHSSRLVVSSCKCTLVASV